MDLDLKGGDDVTPGIRRSPLLILATSL